MDLTRLLINETAKRENVRNRFPGGFYVRAWLRNDDSRVNRTVLDLGQSGASI